MSRLLFLDPGDARWRALLALPEACTFHHPAWIEALHATYGYRAFVAAVPDGAGGVSAGLPIMEVNSLLTGRRWVALPFSDHCCPLAADAAARDALVDELAALRAAGAAPRIEVRWALTPAAAHSASIHQASIQKASTCVFHAITTEGDEEAVWRRVDRMHKGNLRQAERQGVRVLQRTDLAALRAFYRLQVITRRRQGVPVQPWRFFERLGRLLAEGQGFILLAVKDDACAAGGLFLHGGRTLMFKYAASDPAHLGLRPNHLIYAHAIGWACRYGYGRFDLGKTDVHNEGLRAFKRRWGAEESPLVYSFVGGEPGREAGASLAAVAGALIRRAPAWLCRASGELFYRHLG